MPVEMLYFPRPSKFKEPLIRVSFVSRLILADLIDLSQNLNCPFLLEQIQKLLSTRTLGRRNPDKRNVRGASTSRVIHGIAHIQQLLLRTKRRDLPQPV